MNKENVYMITEENYEVTVNECILLYGMIRQLTFQMKRAESLEDFFHLEGGGSHLWRPGGGTV